ncbi:MAG: DEAD/DEAH box helicase, partial [Planctomycetota bacterium]|nr:DEAD/DEAH box helicase [Planctomycetota bacterium]
MTDLPSKRIDWNADLNHPIPISANSWELSEAAEAQVITLPIRVKPTPVQSYYFNVDPSSKTKGNDSAARAFLSSGPKQAKSRKPVKRASRETRTRIKPPRDVVKLSDRLFYALQPPLETLLASNTIEFPFKPFDFQYSGVAFLFPRHCAILADEMGLGKTMQAITSIRMLLRSGYLKNVLLICPKPLVTNWQR